MDGIPGHDQYVPEELERVAHQKFHGRGHQRRAKHGWSPEHRRSVLKRRRLARAAERQRQR